MNVMPVWVQVCLAGARWGVVCGVLFGWVCAGVAGVGIEGTPNLLGTLIAFALVGLLYGTIPGAILGLAVGTVVGVSAGLTLQVALRWTSPLRAVFTTAGIVIGLQVAVIGVLAADALTAVLYLVLPAIEVLPLLRTTNKVAKEWAEPAAYSHRRDTLAA